MKYKEHTAENVSDMCNIWQNRYSDRAGEEYKQSNFDDNFEQIIDKTVENRDNLKCNDIPFTEQNAITCEKSWIPPVKQIDGIEKKKENVQCVTPIVLRMNFIIFWNVHIL